MECIVITLGDTPIFDRPGGFRKGAYPGWERVKAQTVSDNWLKTRRGFIRSSDVKVVN